MQKGKAGEIEKEGWTKRYKKKRNEKDQKEKRIREKSVHEDALLNLLGLEGCTLASKNKFASELIYAMAQTVKNPGNSQVEYERSE